MKWNDHKDCVLKILNQLAAIILRIITVYAGIGLGAVAFTMFSTPMTEWNYELIGIFSALFALGINGITAANSSNAADEQYKDLAEKLDNISDQFEELISIMKGSPEPSLGGDQKPEPQPEKHDPPGNPHHP